MLDFAEETLDHRGIIVLKFLRGRDDRLLAARVKSMFEQVGCSGSVQLMRVDYDHCVRQLFAHGVRFAATGHYSEAKCIQTRVL